MTNTTKPNAKAAPVVLPADLRDYFAAKALVGALANSDSGNGAMEPTMMYVGSHPEEACELLATFAYRLADAMLAARGAA